MKVFYFFLLLAYYIKEIVVSGLVISKIIVSRSKVLNNDGIITFETSLKKNRQVIFLFNLISMTPGTLSIDLYDNNSKIDIHILDMKDEKSISHSLERLEALILKGL